MKKYSRKNLLGKIARKIYELNQETDEKYTLIINKNGFSIKWLNNIEEITTENLRNVLNKLNRR